MTAERGIALLAVASCLVLGARDAAAGTPARASAAQPTSIRPRNPDGNYFVPGVLGEIVYRRVDGVELALDAYLQKRGQSRPAVIVVHGGGWTSGSRIARVGQLLEMLTAAGFSWFSIDYRLAPEHPFPAALDDVRAALEFVRGRTHEFRIDPSRIAILGEDAGAHLATLLAAERPAGLRAVVSMGGVYDLGALARAGSFKARVDSLLGADLGAADGRLAVASPIDRVVPGMPPAMIVHGGADSDVPISQAIAYREALRRAGVACDLLEVPDGIHDVENWRPDQWGYKAAVVAWLAGALDLPEPDFEARSGRPTKSIAYGSFTSPDGAERELLLDAWIPSGAGPFAGVIVVHGGGWEAGDKVTYLTPVLEPLSRAGLAWFSIDYRLTPEYRHERQLEDLRRAIRYVRHHAARFRVDPDRLAMLGESASGQMVALLATQPCGGIVEADDAVDRESCAVRAAVSFYGVYDLLPLVEMSSPPKLLERLFGRSTLDTEGRRLLRRHSPLHHAHAGMPPLLLIHGTDEMLWEQGVAFAERLSQVGAEHELYRLDGAPHGMESWEGRPEWQGYKRKLVNWLARELRKR